MRFADRVGWVLLSANKTHDALTETSATQLGCHKRCLQLLSAISRILTAFIFLPLPSTQQVAERKNNMIFILLSGFEAKHYFSLPH